MISSLELRRGGLAIFIIVVIALTRVALRIAAMVFVNVVNVTVSLVAAVVTLFQLLLVPVIGDHCQETYKKDTLPQVSLNDADATGADGEEIDLEDNQMSHIEYKHNEKCHDK